MIRCQIKWMNEIDRLIEKNLIFLNFIVGKWFVLANKYSERRDENENNSC